MNENAVLWRSRIVLLVALSVSIAFAPLPAAAGEPGQPVHRTNIQASIARIAATQPLAAQTQPAGSSGTDLQSGAFFKKPIGVVVLTALAVGVGFALYSTQHDRVSSAGKK